MTKSLRLAALSVVAVLVTVAVSDAGRLFGGHRRACPAPACPQVICPCPAQPAVDEGVLFVSPKRVKYRIIDTRESGVFAEVRRPPSAVTGVTQPDDFNGHDRKAAKISIADAPLENFANIGKLVDSLAPESEMLALDISKDETSDRVAQEKRNVAVEGFIYAVKAEGDHDFHVILGTAPGENVTFLNVEVSGLPLGGPDRAKLKAARTAFKAFFGEHGSNFGNNYQKFNPPIPVRIEGSLFFDADHPAGVVGPSGMRPKTAWEIHPVTKIEFEIDP